MHVLRRLDQLNLNIPDRRPGGIKHMPPKARRNLCKRHGPRNKNKKTNPKNSRKSFMEKGRF
jgi:hypothetical protein